MYVRQIVLALAVSLTTAAGFGQTPGAGAPPPSDAPGSAFSPETCEAKSLEELNAPALAPSQVSEVCSNEDPFIARVAVACPKAVSLSLIHISEPTRLLSISYAVF